MADTLSPTRKAPRVAPLTALERPPDHETPLQLALAWIFINLTPMTEAGLSVEVFSRTFVADMLAIIATEAFEVNPMPATFYSLRDEVDALVDKERVEARNTIDKLRERGLPVSDELVSMANSGSWLGLFREQFQDCTAGCGAIDSIEGDLRQRITLADEEIVNVQEPLDRLSPLGLYFRGLAVKLRKLGFNETGNLSRGVHAWCGYASAEFDWNTVLGVETRDPSPMSEARGLTRISQMEKHLEAVSTGNFEKSHQSLLAFYDYRAHLDEDTNKMAPHMLLNLAAFHYRTGGLDSARDIVEEAIRVARREGDADALQQTLNLRHRLSTELEGAAWPSAELPKVKNEPVPLRRLMHAVSPADDLWSLAAALDLGEPVPVAFRRIYTALGRTLPAENGDPMTDISSMNTGAWHASQAGLWAMLGSETLSSLHEEAVLSSSDLTRETSLSVTISRAERLSLRGDFSAALALLLKQDTVFGLDHPTYRTWVRGVWSILRRQVELVGDLEAEATLRGLAGEPGARFGPGGPTRDLWEPSAAPTPEERGIVFAHSHVTDALTRVRCRLDADPPAPPHLLLRDTLAALELAAALSLWPTYRAGVVCLAEVLLAMDMPSKADDEVARIWDELVAGPDVLLLARAALARGKAAASSMDQERDGDMERAVEFTDLAVTKAAQIGAVAVLEQANLLREILSQLGAPSTQPVQIEKKGLAETVRRTGEIVRLVGVRVAEGWR